MKWTSFQMTVTLPDQDLALQKVSVNLKRRLTKLEKNQKTHQKYPTKKHNSLLTGTLGVFKTGGAGRASDSGWFQCLALYTAFVGD